MPKAAPAASRREAAGGGSEGARRRAVEPLRSASLPRTSVVSIFDNAFYRGRDRPTVRLRAGGVLTWRWASQQSHQVTLRAGPGGRALADEGRRRATRRASSEPGTYEFVCSIHAPGMRMAAVVR